MWIRKQNKRALVPIGLGGFYPDVLDKLILATSITNSNICEYLGEYSTPERAMEVLDDIANTLKTNASYDEMFGKTRIKKEVVFEMPEK